MKKNLLPYLGIFLILQTLLRISLLGRSLIDSEFSAFEIASLFAYGAWFDIVANSYFLCVILLFYIFIPNKSYAKKWVRGMDFIIRFVFSFIMVFDFVAEHLFWTEFTTRFNFIAVDYLVYTQEVIGNIVESYPLGWVMLAITIITYLIVRLSYKFFPFANLADAPEGAKKRMAIFASLLAICFISHSVSDIEQANIKNNAEATEIASNGIYNLFHAFWHNEIHYSRFYAVNDKQEVEKDARELLSEKNIDFVHDSGEDLTRKIISKSPEKHKNIMLVVMESMSADYMGVFGNKDGITPNLDRLSKEGLFFSNLYATGTRTVRGLEAVTLSIPPTPGQSIIRRPDNGNLFSLGFIMKDRGYDTKFIYGGYGYFDNMNEFFAGNGFDILDRTEMKKEEINFANVWGICDEDMFTRAIKEADISYGKKQPFLHLIMTTSNHRPYTYPDGKIDIKSHTGRYGGVKYADYAVGKLIEDAKDKPWFKDTIFIFVSDHTAGAGGKAELDPHKYHIPMIFYAPSIIKPKEYKNIASQIDLSPILLGMLNFSYYSKFYGEDLLHDDSEIPHAFISNYQKVALVKNNELTVLAPKRKITQFTWPDVVEKTSVDKRLSDDAIAYYQSASWWREHYKRIPTVVK